jgi:DNA-binding Xre family transcriptional regulator
MLWKLIIGQNLCKHDLMIASSVSLNTMTKLCRDEPVMLNVLEKIYYTLGCNYGDVMVYVPDENGARH